MKKVLVTAFEPFGNDSINPTMEVLNALEDMIDGVEIVKLILPVVFGEKLESLLISAIKENQITHVFNLGLASGRYDFCLERVAINLDDGRIADNNGYQPIDTTIKKDGESAYFTTMPVKAMNKAINDIGIRSVISYTAGTYVCNHTMYNVLYYINKNNLNIKSIFIHVPCLPSQTIGIKNMPTMSLNDMVNALRCAIEVSLKVENDIKVVGGNVS